MRRPTSRPQRSRSRSAIPTWPLAKQLLSDCSSFGDCEDIASAHLAGRLFTGREPSLSRSGRASSPPTTCNYDHRRPFASPFEQPHTGWLLRATEADEQSRAVKGKSAPTAVAAWHHYSAGQAYFDTLAANDALDGDRADASASGNYLSAVVARTPRAEWTARHRTVQLKEADCKSRSECPDWRRRARACLASQASNIAPHPRWPLVRPDPNCFIFHR